MTRPVITFVVALAAILACQGSPYGQRATVSIDATTVAALGSFDFETRTQASRAVRRSEAAIASPLLEEAARTHRDEYVRFRALVLLSGFGEPSVPRVMRDVMSDRNDRLRTVAYQWFEHHPDPTIIPTLLEAFPRELSEFVRPALTRALAAQGSDTRVQSALRPLVMRGQDMFRGAVIEALGDYKARYAVSDLLAVAKLDGPLQDDAITALGKIGDPAVGRELAAIRESAGPEVQPTISASFAILGFDTALHQTFVDETLAFSARNGPVDVVRGAVHAAAMLATAGRAQSLAALIDSATGTTGAVREAIALGVGLVALRQPTLLLQVVEGRPSAEADTELFLEAFDMLSEDFAEEQFYVEIRRRFWEAPEGSARRRAAERLLDRLEFS